MVSVLKGLLYSSLSSVDVLCNQYVIVHMLRNALCCFSLNYTILGVGVDRLSAWPIIGADIKHFTDYRYRPF